MNRVCTQCGAPVGTSHMHGPKEKLSWLKRQSIVRQIVIPQKDVKKVMEKLGLKR